MGGEGTYQSEAASAINSGPIIFGAVNIGASTGEDTAANPTDTAATLTPGGGNGMLILIALAGLAITLYFNLRRK